MKELQQYFLERVTNLSLTKRSDFSFPKDNNTRDAFIKLANYVVENFEIPESYEEYVAEHLSNLKNKNLSVVLNDLKEGNIILSGGDCFELPLRAVSVIFSYGSGVKNEEFETKYRTDFLISCLQATLTEKRFKA